MKNTNNQLKEGDLVICTVKRIEGATVFLELENNLEGSMMMSEVAAGRIRNLRSYVSPNKKVVCKILKITPDNIQLSLRRVTAKEKEAVMEQYKKEKVFQTILNSVGKEPQKIIEAIKKEYSLLDFFNEARQNPSILEKFLSKEEAANLSKMILEKEDKEKEVKKVFVLKSTSENGISDIKYVLNVPLEIKYLGSSQFLISSKGKDFKDAEHKIAEILREIEKRAKEKKCFFEIKEKK